MSVTIQTYSHAREIATGALASMLPSQPDIGWLERFVDGPRFGWDWAALEQGFFAPLRDWAGEHDARLRPALAAMLIDGMGGAADEHRSVLAALELHYLASIMLDDLRNGRDLSRSTDDAVTIPLPVWVTIAYNARQLAPVLVMRSDETLSPTVRQRIGQRFAAFLFRQGLGSTLDLRVSEQNLQQASLGELVSHLSLYVGPLSFGLSAEVAAVVAGLDEAATNELSASANRLGVAARLHALAAGDDQHLRMGDRSSREQRLRWRSAFPAAALADTAAELQRRAFVTATTVDPAAAATMREFFQQMSQTNRKVHA